MRYLLVVGFACDVFRREPRARIFVGDRLVDEFSIPHAPSSWWPAREEFLKKKSHILQPCPWSDIDNLWMKNHPPLKFYELQCDDEITNLTLRIDIHNHDSNHSNGYMTRSTLIRLEACVLFPLHAGLLRRLEKIRVIGRMSENYAWYRAQKNQIFDIVLNGMRWQGANGRNIANSPSACLSAQSIGGGGAWVCELEKKYGMLLPRLARACRLYFNYPLISNLFDKYQQHAHQRDSD